MDTVLIVVGIFAVVFGLVFFSMASDDSDGVAALFGVGCWCAAAALLYFGISAAAASIHSQIAAERTQDQRTINIILAGEKHFAAEGKGYTSSLLDIEQVEPGLTRRIRRQQDYLFLTTGKLTHSVRVTLYSPVPPGRLAAPDVKLVATLPQ